jgi:hypothetical protein
MAIARAASPTMSMSMSMSMSLSHSHEDGNNNNTTTTNSNDSNTKATTVAADDDHEHDLVMPGFRFHPTEEELVEFYLRRKVEGKRFNVELITFLDLYRYDPWELPGIYTYYNNNENFPFLKAISSSLVSLFFCFFAITF